MYVGKKKREGVYLGKRCRLRNVEKDEVGRLLWICCCLENCSSCFFFMPRFFQHGE